MKGYWKSILFEITGIRALGEVFGFEDKLPGGAKNWGDIISSAYYQEKLGPELEKFNRWLEGAEQDFDKLWQDKSIDYLGKVETETTEVIIEDWKTNVKVIFVVGLVLIALLLIWKLVK